MAKKDELNFETDNNGIKRKTKSLTGCHGKDRKELR